jgi:hypothetical protein
MLSCLVSRYDTLLIDVISVVYYFCMGSLMDVFVKYIYLYTYNIIFWFLILYIFIIYRNNTKYNIMGFGNKDKIE